METQTTVKERLITYLKSIGYSQRMFEEAIGASNGYVNNISKGIGPGYLSVVKERFPLLNIEWLMTGEGQMLNETEAPKEGPGDTMDRLLTIIEGDKRMLEESHRALINAMAKKDEFTDRLLSIMEADRGIAPKKEAI